MAPRYERRGDPHWRTASIHQTRLLTCRDRDGLLKHREQCAAAASHARTSGWYECTGGGSSTALVNSDADSE